MPTPATETPPAQVTPPAPPAPPAPPNPPASNLEDPPQPMVHPFDPENSADHQIKDLIEGRERRKAKAAGEANRSGDKPAAAPAATPPADAGKPLGSLISGALKFRTKKEEKAGEAPPAASVTPPASEAKASDEGKDGKEGKEGKEDGKPTKGTKRAAQPAQPALDPNRIAEAAAAAAATAAVSAVQGKASNTSPDAAIVAQMTDEERYDYDLAKFMASTYPHLKGADNKFLDNFRRTEVYKRSWESANPGKQFNPDDDEHDAHFSTIQKPWKDFEYHEAIADRKESAREKKQSEATSKELKRLEQQNARLEMAPIVDDTVTNAFGVLLKGYDDQILQVIGKPGGWEELGKKNPVVARNLAGAVQEMKPLVEAIIHIDDPKARTPIDLSNPAHKRWAEHLIASEAKYAGMVNDAGKRFATRSEYGQMSAAQQAQHFYLTTEHLLEELVDSTLNTVKGRIDSELSVIKSAAEAMGWAPPAPSGSASQATNQPAQPPSGGAATVTQKPVSPAFGSSTKNDVKDPAGQGGVAGTLAATAKVLFNR